jgi:hypothetical protein
MMLFLHMASTVTSCLGLYYVYTRSWQESTLCWSATAFLLLILKLFFDRE